MSAVRIHDDAEADKLAKKVNATAFTTGQDIYFRSGKFKPNTQSGLELLAHEVTHTVQQSKGKVGKGIDPDSGLEQEAQAAGRQLARLSPTPKIKQLTEKPRRSAPQTGSSALQRQYAGPIIVPALQNQNLFQPGTGQAWDDTGMAVQQVIQVLPARLKAHYAQMPAQLLSGMVELLKITIGGLAVGTAAGGLLGAFFGGAPGAVLGAQAGYELASFGLAAWGLGSLLTGLRDQIGSLHKHLAEFASMIKQAKSNKAKIRQASEQLIQGIIILCDGVLSAIALLLVHKGLPYFKVSTIGKKLGAISESSAPVQWLRARSGMESTREVYSTLKSEVGSASQTLSSPNATSATLSMANGSRVQSPEATSNQMSRLRNAGNGVKIYNPPVRVRDAITKIKNITPAQVNSIWQLMTDAVNTPNFKAIATFEAKLIEFNKNRTTDMSKPGTPAGLQHILTELKYAISLAKKDPKDITILPGMHGPRPKTGKPSDFDLRMVEKSNGKITNIEIRAGTVEILDLNKIGKIIDDGINHAADKAGNIPKSQRGTIRAAVSVEFRPADKLDLSKDGHQVINTGTGQSMRYLVQNGIATEKAGSAQDVSLNIIRYLNSPDQVAQPKFGLVGEVELFSANGFRMLFKRDAKGVWYRWK